MSKVIVDVECLNTRSKTAREQRFPLTITISLNMSYYKSKAEETVNRLKKASVAVINNSIT